MRWRQLALLLGATASGVIGTSDARADVEIGQVGPCNVAIVGSPGATVHVVCPGVSVVRSGSRYRVTIDQRIVFDGTNNLVDVGNNDLVFAPGGEFHVEGSGALTVRARSISTLGGGIVRITGTGTRGSDGSHGRDGNGGAPGACRPEPTERDSDGHPVWRTGNHDDWINANVSCDHDGASCDRGLDGGRASDGLAGPAVNIYVQRTGSGSWTVGLHGGPPGSPGTGGLGMRHVDSGTGDVHVCPPGGTGGTGNAGPDGVCTITVGRRAPAPCAT